MGFFFTYLYVCLAFLSPADTLPQLAALGLMPALTALGFCFSFLAVLNHREVLRHPQTPLLLLLLYALIILSLPLHFWLGGAARGFKDFSPPVVTFFLVLTSLTTAARFRWLGNAFILLAIYFTCRSILALYFGIGSNTYTIYQSVETSEPFTGGAGFIVRAIGAGFLSDPNDLAQQLLLSAPFLGLFWQRGNFVRNFLLVILPASLILFGVYLTQSRGAIVGILILLGFAFKKRMGAVGPLFGGVLVVILVLLLGFGGGRVISATSGSGGGRLAIWSDALAAVKENPLIGVGYGNITDYTYMTAHNTLLLCLAELGFIGYFVFVALFVTAFMQLQLVPRLVPGPSQEEHALRRYASAMTLSLAMFLATGFFLSRAYIVTPYILLAMSSGLYLMARSRAAPGTAVPSPRWLIPTLLSMVTSTVVIYMMVRLRWA